MGCIGWWHAGWSGPLLFAYGIRVLTTCDNSTHLSKFCVSIVFSQLRPPMMVRLLRKLSVDVPALNENTVTPLRVRITFKDSVQSKLIWVHDGWTTNIMFFPIKKRRHFRFRMDEKWLQNIKLSYLGKCQYLRMHLMGQYMICEKLSYLLYLQGTCWAVFVFFLVQP